MFAEELAEFMKYETYYDAAGVRTRCFEKGEGDAVILLHGGGGHAETWVRNLLPLSEQFRVLAIDYLGHGFTDKPAIAYNMEAFSKHLLDYMEAAGVEPPGEHTSFEEFTELANALTQDTDGDGDTDIWGISNMVSVGRGAGGAYWIIKSFGGELFNEENTASMMNSPETVAALQWLADLLWDSGAHPTAESVAATGFTTEFLFANGNVAMHYALNDAAARMWELVGDSFNWTVVPTPTGPAGRYNFIGGSAFSVPASAAHPDLSYELIRFTLANPAHLCRTAAMGAALTSQSEFHNCAAPDDAPYADAYHEVFSVIGARDGVSPAYQPKYLEWETSVWVANMDLLWTGEERDASVVVQRAHDQTNELLGG